MRRGSSARSGAPRTSRGSRATGSSSWRCPRLEAETGVATGFRCNGSVSVARTAERMTELRRLASMARCFGVEVAPIGPAEAGKLWPLMRTDDLVGAVHIPGDAQTNPGQTALALAAGARRGGVTILEDVVVTGVEVRHGRVSGVLTEGGRIACETVVNCGGLWARGDRAHGSCGGAPLSRPSTRRGGLFVWSGDSSYRARAARRRRAHLPPRTRGRSRHGRLRAGGQGLGRWRASRRASPSRSSMRTGL